MTKQTNMRLSNTTRAQLEWLALEYGMTLQGVVAMLIRETFQRERTRALREMYDAADIAAHLDEQHALATADGADLAWDLEHEADYQPES